MDVNNPSIRPILNILKSSRNGIVYGGKVRFSHALVISLLYKSGSIRSRLAHVIKATKNHSEVLAAFSIVYKSLTYLLSKLAHIEQQNKDNLFGIDHSNKINLRLIKFLSGCAASYVVYSQSFSFFNKGITHQVTLYCFSRVVIALAKIVLDQLLVLQNPKIDTFGSSEPVPFIKLNEEQQIKLKGKLYGMSWKWFSVLVWGTVMFIYDYKPGYLQSSLRYSMSYIYDTELEEWSSFRDLIGI